MEWWRNIKLDDLPKKVRKINDSYPIEEKGMVFEVGYWVIKNQPVYPGSDCRLIAMMSKNKKQQPYANSFYAFEIEPA